MNDENCMKLMLYIWIMYELFFDSTLSIKKLMFNKDPLASLMI